MQILFYTESNVESYSNGTGYYPEAPSRCPHCQIPVKMSKHGFYKRYIIHTTYEGNIRIRRYICHDCCKTVSMLPSFCVPRYQYSVEIIIMSLLTAILNHSVNHVVKKWSQRPESLTKRHVIHYRKRITQNRGTIQLGLNLMSPEFIDLKQITGDTDWTKEFLEVVTQIKPPQFNAKYHELTNRNFMSSHNKIA
jgi:hypothetical protein